MTVTLRVRDQPGLDRLLRVLYDPASPSYRHFLTPQEFARRFAPDETSLARVAGWLRQQGLAVTGIAANRLAITARGDAATIEQAFSTPIVLFRQGGQTVFANTRPIRLPASLARGVLAVSGLTDAGPQRTWSTQRRPSVASTGYTPAALAHLYDVSPLQARGVDGSGQTVAVISFADYSTENLAVFDRRFGLAANVTRIAVSDGTTSTAPKGTAHGQDEIEADIEAVQGMAPKAAILVYEAPNSAAGGVAVYNQVVSDNRAAVVSTSWGNVESAFTAGDRNAIHQALEQGAAQGQAFFAPSGDYGAFDGAGKGHANAKTLAVDYPASDPWVTGVGGTTLEARNSHYVRETVWADTTNSWAPQASGGGLSAVFLRPDYQQGPGVRNEYSSGMRQVPDVAANADPATGYAAYVSGPSDVAGWAVMGGTSEAAPLWASFAALVNQAAGRRVGFLNPSLYALGKHARRIAGSPFHDVTVGGNLYYPATPGWDFATGWGSMAGNALVTAMTGGRAAAASPDTLPRSPGEAGAALESYPHRQ